MKLMHIGDLHLGKSLGDFDLTQDQEYLLDQLLEIAEKQKADAVLIAGDVYDKAVPSEAATRMLDHFLSERILCDVDHVINRPKMMYCFKNIIYRYTFTYIKRICFKDQTGLILG